MDAHDVPTENEIDSVLQHLKAAVSNVERCCNHSIEIKSALQDEISAVKKDNDILKKDKESLQREIELLQYEKKQLSEGRTAMSNRIEALHGLMRGWNTERQTLMNELEESKNVTVHLATKIDEIKAVAKKWQSLALNQRQRRRALERELEKIMNDVKDVSAIDVIRGDAKVVHESFYTRTTYDETSGLDDIEKVFPESEIATPEKPHVPIVTPAANRKTIQDESKQASSPTNLSSVNNSNAPEPIAVLTILNELAGDAKKSPSKKIPRKKSPSRGEWISWRVKPRNKMDSPVLLTSKKRNSNGTSKELMSLPDPSKDKLSYQFLNSSSKICLELTNQSKSSSPTNLKRIKYCEKASLPTPLFKAQEPKINSNELDYVYSEVVRGKDARAAMRGVDCKDCRKFVDELVASGAVVDRQEMLDCCSRHRVRRGHPSPPSTAEGFWRLTFSDSPPTRRPLLGMMHDSYYKDSGNQKHGSADT